MLSPDQILEKIGSHQPFEPHSPFDPFEPFDPMRRRPMPTRPFEVNQKKEVINTVRRRSVA